MFKLLCHLFLTSVVMFSSAHASDLPFRAGVGMVELIDPVSQQTMRAAIFYPTVDAVSVTRLGPLEILAKRDAAVSSGRFPLVLLSHGNGGSMFSHHDMAVSLAHHGFVVAAVEHPGDNFKDESGQGSDRVWIGRQQQLTALLDFFSGKVGVCNGHRSRKNRCDGFLGGCVHRACDGGSSTKL
jgi:predicted dienelactone hydrolase